MTEFWKSTERYWCKNCEVFVRDTKLERSNHEATARHQGNLKRSLRDLHRSHEREERDKDRAKQEVARLNGVVSGSYGGGDAGDVAAQQHTGPATQNQLQKQREQLAAMGIEMPSAVRPEMAMPGEWTVTATKVIQISTKDENGEENVEARATGIRKREATEDEKEEENAVAGLFKKPRRWGRDTKMLRADEDSELDALLSGSLLPIKKSPENEDEVKKEEHDTKDSDTKLEDTESSTIKAENDDKESIKNEPDTAAAGLTEPVPKQEAAGSDDAVPAVVFKKRKAKTLRTK